MAKVTDDMIKYDTAYVELMKIVEQAMEIPVIEIRKDINELLTLAFNIFDDILNERARIGKTDVFIWFIFSYNQCTRFKIFYFHSIDRPDLLINLLAFFLMKT